MEGLEIYGGKWALDRIQALIYGIVMPEEQANIPIHLVDLHPGLFFEDKDFTVSAFPVTHRGPGCFGFIFQEKSRRPFLNEKAEALGVPFGRERASLVAGEPLILPDGRTIQPDDVLGPDLPGARYVHIGDVGRTDNIHEYVQDAHALVMEATYLDADADLAKQFGHMTAGAAARLAAETNVQTLILSHISHRSRERDVLAEAQHYFPNSYVARDFDRFSINKERGTQRLESARAGFNGVKGARVLGQADTDENDTPDPDMQQLSDDTHEEDRL